MTHEAFLRMSVMNALVEIRRARARDPDFILQNAAFTLTATGVSEATFDYEVAIALIGKFPNLGEPSVEPQTTIVRQAIGEIIAGEKPRWSTSIPYGRHVLRESLASDNALQCFTSAGLFDDDSDAYDWWDNVAALVRSERDEMKQRLGREGESLSLDHERKRLIEEGLSELHPTWDSRDNETLGYDIGSFFRNGDAVHQLLIEAKAASDDPLIFHLTPREWKVAQSRPNSYLFHVWHLPTKSLTTIRPDELREHVPSNTSRATWESLRITWPSE